METLKVGIITRLFTIDFFKNGENLVIFELLITVKKMYSRRLKEVMDGQQLIGLYTSMIVFPQCCKRMISITT
jgi:hypothetical protein